MRTYEGRIAVVTGASSGLGRRIALELAQRGAVVTGVARNEARLAEVEEQLQKVSPGSGTRVCDVSDADRYAALLTEVEAEQGRVDVLVNAAGVERRVFAEDATLALYRETMATNFFATVAGTLAVLPGMLARGDGVILNVSSDHGRAPGPGTAAYCASKAAVSAFTESVSYEVDGRGVSLHVLYPGWVPTPLGQGAVDAGMPLPPKIVHRTEEQVAKLALERMGGRLLEINAARIATLAPMMRGLLPRLYRKGMLKAGA